MKIKWLGWLLFGLLFGLLLLYGFLAYLQPAFLFNYVNAYGQC